jgi:hemin uptake protein HemP
MNASADEEKKEGSDPADGRTEAIRRHLTIADNRIDSRDLFIGTRDIIIVHGRDAYHLRLTAQNKLILTK